MSTLWQRYKQLKELLANLQLQSVTATGQERAALEVRIEEVQKELADTEDALDRHRGLPQSSRPDTHYDRAEEHGFHFVPITALYEHRLARVERVVSNIETNVNTLRVEVAALQAHQQNFIRNLWLTTFAIGIIIIAGMFLVPHLFAAQ